MGSYLNQCQHMLWIKQIKLLINDYINIQMANLGSNFLSRKFLGFLLFFGNSLAFLASLEPEEVKWG